MKHQQLGKWSAFCAVTALFAASGTQCPQTSPIVSTSSLTGLWTGTITGDVTLSFRSSPVPPNPTASTFNSTSPSTNTQQLVFFDNADGNGIPATLPLYVFGLNSSFFDGAVTAFNVGETQSFTSTFTQEFPFGPAGNGNDDQMTTTTLTVTESTLSADHFRVVYDTTNTRTINSTSADPGHTCGEFTSTSTGTLIFEATATDGLLNFSVEFNNSETSSNTIGPSPCPPAVPTTATQDGTAIGKLEGILARD